MSYTRMQQVICLRNEKLDATQKAILMVLAFHENDSTGDCFPSVGKIAEEAACSLSTARRSIQKMTGAGILATEAKKTRNGFVHQFKFHLDPCQIDTCQIDTCQIDTPTPVKLTPHPCQIDTLTSKIYKEEQVNILCDQNDSSKKFQKPTLEELKTYCDENGYEIDCSRFMDYYDSKGWVVGKSPMRDWKAAVRTWVRNSKADFRKDRSFTPHADESYLRKESY